MPQQPSQRLSRKEISAEAAKTLFLEKKLHDRTTRLKTTVQGLEAMETHLRKLLDSARGVTNDAEHVRDFYTM